MPFNVALSGLNAASSDLEVTANNIANTNTTGFKGSRAEFAELYSNASDNLSATSIGNGVRLADVAQQFATGNIESTSSNMDFAISGDGFFTLHDGSGYSYTRAGSFQPDRNGNVINAAGQHLQVFPPDGNGGFDSSTMANLKLDTAQQAAKATTSVDTNVNLPANATVPKTATFSTTDPTSYNQSTSFTVYDSLGATHSATVYYVKGATPGSWTANLYVDGSSAGSQPLTFDSSGKLATPSNGQLNFSPVNLTTGANPLTLTINAANTTQSGETYSVASIGQNGYPTGTPSGINVSDTGIISATFSNGQSKPLGQLALANFANTQGLNQIDNTNWTASYKSGDPVMGTAGSGKLGNIQSGALESSNTSDLTQQLVNMIRAQRNYQANAKVITTDNQLTKTIINIQT